MSKDKCTACGKNWSDHLGVQPTCQQLQDALSALKVIYTWASLNDLDAQQVMSLIDRTMGRDPKEQVRNYRMTRKTTKGRPPTPDEIQRVNGVKFDFEAWSKDNPGYPDPLCDPEDWTPPPKRWRGLEEYLYIEDK